MRRLLVAFLCVSSLLGSVGCGGVSVRTLGISVSVPNSFSQIYASSAPITLTATTDDDPTSKGVIWRLSLANAACTPGCGTLSPSTTNPLFSIVYTPPTTPPSNTTATITAVSIADNAAVFVFNFTILPAISVTITNKFSTQTSGDPSVEVKATVTNDLSKAGVTWTLTAGGQPCSPGCGTLTASASPSFSATYTPPGMAPAGTNDSPTITATSVTDSTKSDSFNFTIVQGIVVTITNKFLSAQIGGSPIVVNASVIADPANAGVTWTLTAGGGLCSPDCGTLAVPPSPTFTATYTPPTVLPTGSNTPTITATSVTNPTKSDSFTFSITANLSLFQGSYAFLLRGFDLSGLPMAMAGSVTSDGNGKITGGEVDANNDGGISFGSMLSGSYTFRTLGTPFNKVTLVTITVTSPDFPGIIISFRVVLSNDGAHGRILELDGNSFINVGTIELQDPSSLSAANPTGSYAFGVDSDAPVGGRTVEAGQLILNSTGVTGGLIDVSKSGDPLPRYTKQPLLASPFALSPDSSGRGTLALSVAATTVQTTPPTNLPASSDNYAFYMVNSGKIILIQTDHTPTFGTVYAGVARLQKALTANTVAATSVLQLTGMDAVPGTTSQVGPDVIIGVMSIPIPGSTGTTSFQLTFDENDLGNFINSKVTAGGISFDATTGRGTISDIGGFGQGFMDAAVFYLYDVGAGFVIDDDISTCVPGGICPPPMGPITNNAFSGTFIPQAPGPFTGQIADLMFASGASAIPDIPCVVAAAHLDPTQGGYTAMGDLTSLTSEAGNLPDVPFNGNFTLTDGNLGHGIVGFPSQFFGAFPAPGAPQTLYPSTFYMISPTQFVAIGSISKTTDSGVMFFDPE